MPLILFEGVYHNFSNWANSMAAVFNQVNTAYQQMYFLTSICSDMYDYIPQATELLQYLLPTFSIVK